MFGVTFLFQSHSRWNKSVTRHNFERSQIAHDRTVRKLEFIHYIYIYYVYITLTASFNKSAVMIITGRPVRQVWHFPKCRVQQPRGILSGCSQTGQSTLVRKFLWTRKKAASNILLPPIGCTINNKEGGKIKRPRNVLPSFLMAIFLDGLLVSGPMSCHL